MKIVHIAPNAPYNDYWGYQDNLLPKYHRKMGYDVTVITTNTAHKDGKIVEIDCGDYVLDDGVRVIRLKKKQYFNIVLTNLNSRLSVYEYLADIKPDIVFHHGLISTTIYDVIKYKKKINPECVIFQDNHLDYNNMYRCNIIKEWICRLFYRHINRRSIPYVERVYGVTPWRKTYAEDYFRIPNNKTDILVMGGDDEKIHFDKMPELRTDIRKQLSLKDDDFVVITGGKIDPTKNIHLLMHAVSELNRDNLKLIVFGTPNNGIKSEIEKLSEDKHIINIGWLDSEKAYDYFLASDLAVFPGTHSVLWEQACACGIPGVFKDWEGMHHIDVGGNCEFLHKDSKEEIKAVISSIFDDKEKYSEMKQAAEKSKKDFFYSEIAKRAIGN